MMNDINVLLTIVGQTLLLLTVLLTTCGSKKQLPPIPKPKTDVIKSTTTKLNETPQLSDKRPDSSEKFISKDTLTGEELKEKKEDIKEKEYQEDSFDALKPRKAEAWRTKEIKDERVLNKEDYKTWISNYDNDDFDKSLHEVK